MKSLLKKAFLCALVLGIASIIFTLSNFWNPLPKEGSPIKFVAQSWHFFKDVNETNVEDRVTVIDNSFKDVSEKDVEDRVTVIDSTFYDGEPVLLFRLAMLYDKVDRFYIVESNYTMDGRLKTTLHKDDNAELFEPYKDKIQWVVPSEEEDVGTKAVALDDRKRAFRIAFKNKATADLEEGIISEPFVFINSEVDEIINPNDIDEFQPGKKLHDLVTQLPVILRMDSFDYNLNWKREEKVANAEILPGRLLDNPNILHMARGGGSKQATQVSPEIDSGYRLANFFDFNALSNKIEYPISTTVQFNDDLRKDACAEKCVSGEEGCKWWQRCNLDLQQWDYKQAPASLQRFHELICKVQNVDPATGTMLTDDSNREAFSSVARDIQTDDRKDWESSAGDLAYKGDKVTILDSVQYNGEPVVFARLATLYDVVDRFYISEGTHTHAGLKKDKLYKDLNAHLFEPYEDKIHWVVDDMNEYDKDNIWGREKGGRRSTWPRIREDFEKGEIIHPFVIMSMDVDEVPEPADIAAFQPGKKYHDAAISSLVIFEMNFFYYNLNWKHITRWPMGLTVPGHLAFVFGGDFDFLRMDRMVKWAGAKIKGGYHMSYFLSVNEIRRKIESFAHQEFNKEELKTDEHIFKCVSTGHDMYNRRTGPRSQQWDYRQAPLALQKFHKEICQMQNVAPLISDPSEGGTVE
jgi:beta-1,4-mannosyl-glycoprotein beta-1,4-N-acetylglucosaminyltransferase